MDAFEIVLGFLLALAAVVLVTVGFSVGNIVPFGAAILTTGGAVALIWIGIHNEHAKFHHKHVVIYNALKNDFSIKSSDVYAVGGNYFAGTEVDIRTGKCYWPFIARKVGGVWHAILPHSGDRDSGSVLTRADVATLAKVCS